MLTDHDHLLIAAAVDAELSPAQANAFHRLVTDKPEAARLFRRLKADAARLRAVPPVVPPAGLTAAVMTRVTALPTAALARPARRLAAWLPYAVAASALLAVGLGSYVLFRPAADRGLATRPTPDQPTPPPAPAGSPTPLVAAAKPGPAVEEPFSVAKAGPDAREPLPAPQPDVVVARDPAPPQDLLGAGLAIESKPLKVVDLTLPVVVPAGEFDRDDAQARLEAELARESAVRIDLFSKTPAAALDHLTAAARGAGVSLFTDAVTAERLKKPNGFTFAVYLDNLTATEHAKLFAALARQVNAQPKPEAVLGAAHLIPAGAVDQKDVKELVGVEFGGPKPAAKPVEKGGAGDEPKPISADTITKVAQAVKKAGEKAGVVVTYLPANFRGAAKSAEVKQFQDKRGERKPGAVAVLVVIR